MVVSGGRVRDKVIIVTGASSGIGKAAALRLAEEGAKLGLLDVVSSATVVDEIVSAGGEATAIQCDVRDAAQVEEAVRSISQKYGDLDGAANMAGVIGNASTVGTQAGSLLNVRDEEWDRILAINVTGMKNCLRSELRHMKSSGGSIVNAGSVSAQVGSPYNAAYGASKAAVMSLSVSTAQEMGRKGVRVNAIAPGIIETPLLQELPHDTRTSWFEKNAMGRPGKPAEVANMILFLLSDEASFCTGTVYNIDAGRR